MRIVCECQECGWRLFLDTGCRVDFMRSMHKSEVHESRLKTAPCSHIFGDLVVRAATPEEVGQ